LGLYCFKTKKKKKRGKIEGGFYYSASPNPHLTHKTSKPPILPGWERERGGMVRREDRLTAMGDNQRTMTALSRRETAIVGTAAVRQGQMKNQAIVPLHNHHS